MIPVVPYQVRRAEDGLRGQLLLRLRHGKSAYIVELPMEQARQLAVEMRGLASDHCPLHHLSLNLTQSLGAQVSHIILQRNDQANEVLGIVCLETSGGSMDVNVDATAALAMAIHIGLPIFMDGDFASTEGDQRDTHKEVDTTVPTPIPEAFWEVIDGIDQRASGDEQIG